MSEIPAETKPVADIRTVKQWVREHGEALIGRRIRIYSNGYWIRKGGEYEVRRVFFDEGAAMLRLNDETGIYKDVLIELLDPIVAPPTDASRIAALTADVERLTRELEDTTVNLGYANSLIEVNDALLAERHEYIKGLTAENQRLTDALAAIGARLREGESLIWCGEWGAYFRPNSAGYTSDIAQAGAFPREQAERIAKGCGPEKGIVLLPSPALIGEIRALAGVQDDG